MAGKGKPKTGGRKKGSLNKNNKTFRELLEQFEGGKGFEPVQELMTLYTLIYADNPLVAVKILIALMDRLHPTLKSVDHSSKDGTMAQNSQVVVMLPPKNASLE